MKGGSDLDRDAAAGSEVMVGGGSANGRMHILFATDGSKSADAALRFLQQLVVPARTVVHVVCVIPVWFSPYDEGGVFIDWDSVVREARPGAEQTVREACSELAGKAIEVSGIVKDGDPAAEIMRAAEDWGAELVVVGARGLGAVRGFFLGSVAREVARHSPYPVLVAHAPHGDLRQVIVATDGSEHARRAVAFAGRLPLSPEAVFTAVHVIKPYRWFSPRQGPGRHTAAEELRQQQLGLAGRIASEAEHCLKQIGRRVSAAVREGDPASEIHQAAEEAGADLIVVGARGVSPLRGLVVGSVADRLLTEARVSVLIVP